MSNIGLLGARSVWSGAPQCSAVGLQRRRILLLQLRLCRRLCACYLPVVLLPLFTAFWSLEAGWLQAFGVGWLGLALYSLGLFQFLFEEADLEYLLRDRGLRGMV